MSAVHCEGCNKAIKHDDEYVMSDDAKIYHRTCYSKDIKCCYCDGVVLGQLKQVLDRNYHPKCWVCTGCSKNLGDGEYHEHNAWPYCPSCAKNQVWVRGKRVLDPVKDHERLEKLKKMRELAAQLAKDQPILGEIALDDQAGFTIDPVTGKKKPSHHAAANRPTNQ